jgi:predicted DNA-binding transcriptional regulator AlpA
MTMRFLTFAQLHERGILPSRQHTRRLIERGIIPKPYRLGDPDRGRLAWLESDIEEYVRRRAAERDMPRRNQSGSTSSLIPADGANVVPMRRRPPGLSPRSDVPKMILTRPTR